MGENKCKCGNFFAVKCINKLCNTCCKNKDCERHNLIIKEKLCKCGKLIVDNCDSCILCCCYHECMNHDSQGPLGINHLSVNEFVNTLAEYTGLCKSLVDYVLLDYSVKINICSVCKYKEHNQVADKKNWNCDMCGIYFCYNCMTVENKILICEITDCQYCSKGCCYNNKLEGQYCSACFVIVDDMNYDAGEQDQLVVQAE